LCDPCFEDGQDGGPPFEDVDTNGDGVVDRDEARDFFGDEPNFDEEYDKVDANGDGMVDHAEYMAADDGGGDHEDGDGDDGPPPFEDVDSNGDGSIDRDEARDYFGDEPNFDEEYDKVDTNGDGVVDHAEYMASDGGDHDGPQHYPSYHWDGYCGAMMNGESEYWLDSDGDPDNGPEDGPYAVWHEDADGNPVNCGPGPGGPPPPTCEEVDTNGDGSIDRDEARNFFGDEPNFDEEYDKVDTNGDGVVDHAEYMASDGGDHDGGGTCDVCGHEYGGPDDHHGHCRVCGAEMNTDDDWNAHCDENWEHCKPQAGDTCGYVGPNGGDECGYVHTGDPDEDHHHCDTCGMPVNSGDEMGAHCDENPGHCHDDGPPPFEDVDSNGDGVVDREEARDYFGYDPIFD